MKPLVNGEWVRVRNMMNEKFKAKSPCEVCHKFTCGVVWYSIITKSVRCVDCFDPHSEPSRSDILVIVDRE